MKGNAAQIFLVIAICSLALAAPAVLQPYSIASRITLFSTDLSFENSDQSHQLKDHQRGPDVCLSNELLIALSLETDHLKRIPRFYSLKASLDERTFFLRC